MLASIKNRIDKELTNLIANSDAFIAIKKISPLLYQTIKGFLLRDGKRIRPILFIISYRGYCKKLPANIYKSALALELLHDFLLIHDDIIDKSETRRGKPSVHSMLNSHILKFKKVKFNGQDLAIVAGDVIFAAAMNTFLAVKENPLLKEKALQKMIETAMLTGSGEFIELVNSLKKIETLTKEEVYKVYDYKTAYYTFSGPLIIGATLAAAKQKEINLLNEYGLYLGRAFQIKDDILGMFYEEKVTGKSIMCDLQEAKRTILIWYAYNMCKKEEKTTIKKIFAKNKVSLNDLTKMRNIIKNCGALDCAKEELRRFRDKALAIAQKTTINRYYKSFLQSYPLTILDL